MKSNFLCTAHLNINQRECWCLPLTPHPPGCGSCPNPNSENQFICLTRISGHRCNHTQPTTATICQSKASTETLENANQMHLTQIKYNFFPGDVRQVQRQWRDREAQIEDDTNSAAHSVPVLPISHMSARVLTLWGLDRPAAEPQINLMWVWMSSSTKPPRFFLTSDCDFSWRTRSRSTALLRAGEDCSL